MAKNGAESRDDGLVGNAGGFEKGVHLKQENVNMRVDVQAVGDIPARGSTRAALLLKDLVEDRLGGSPGAGDVLQALRLWRRHLGRAEELHVQLPDPLVITNLLTKWADHIGRLGGAQTAYRISTVRQALDLDRRPTPVQTTEFAEVLQAEAEQLVLMRSATLSTMPSGAQENGKKKELLKAAALSGGGFPSGGQQSQQRQSGGGEGTTKPKCKFWGTTTGCKRGESCTYLHSWEGIQKKGRCWNCSAEGHMKPECPFLKSDTSGGKEKIAKSMAKGGSKGKTSEKGSGGGQKEGEESTSAPSSSAPSSKPSSPTKPDKSVIETASANELVTEVTSLMKSLRALKAVQLRYMEASRGEDSRGEQKVALVDGGATHALRRGTKEELARSKPISVELAKGSTTLFRMPGCSTLFAEEEVEPIIPVRLLIDHGYQVKWDKTGCVIVHPQHGAIKSWRRAACPVMDRDAGLRLLHELEEKEKNATVDDGVQAWWKERYPEVPHQVWDFMKGQDQDWKTCGGTLPWNRYKRRQIETAKGVILHVFAGDGSSAQRWRDLQEDGWVVLTLDVLSGANENLHNPAVWAYLWMLAKEGKLRILFGGPPCRSTSRLRHRQPGPRPLRGRGPRRFALENLAEDEERLVHGDSALIFKMLGLFEVMVEAKSGEGEPAFLMEHPSDPADYIAVTEEQDFPSVWNWPEVEKFEKKHNLHRVRFDQGATGHVRRKPTTLCTSLEEMKELDGLKAKGEPKEELKEELSERLVQTASWAAWSPGLVAAVKMAFRNFMKGGPKCKRFTVDEWRQHVRQNHVPFRRDCRVCIEEMGQDLPHRRRKASEAGESAYVLAVDVIGPFIQGGMGLWEERDGQVRYGGYSTSSYFRYRGGSGSGTGWRRSTPRVS